MRYIQNEKKSRKSWRQMRKTALALAFVLGVTQFSPVLASNLDKAKDKKNEAQEGLNATQKEINQIEKQQDALQGEIDALDRELVDVIVNLEVLETDLKNKEEQLVQVQADLEQAKQDEAEQYEAMKKRIRFMYERGDTAFLVSILESQSITDMLNRVEYVNKVYDYDRQLLVSYQDAKQQVEELELQVQSDIADLEGLQADYLEQQKNYETMIARKQGQMSDFDTKLAKAKKLASELENTIYKQNEIIRKEEERKRQEEEERRKQEEANKKPGGSSNGGNESGGGKNPGYVTNVSGADVVEYACRYIGNPYVFGGNDINNGIDCSGFTKYVFGHFGISLPRYSGDQRNCGQAVSYANAQPGDLIFYSGHVAIYIGNGKIVHASNSKPYPAGGIKISNATYNTILAVRRVL